MASVAAAISKRDGLLTISLLSASFIAIYRTMDNITINNFITASDELTAVLAYLLVGGWIGTTLGIIYCRFLGKWMDTEFRGIIIRNVSMHKKAFFAGFFGAVSTFFVLWGNRFGDQSVIIALTNATVLYTVVYEIYSKEISVKFIAIPALLIVAGSFLGSYQGKLGVTLTGLLIVFVGANLFSAAGEIVERPGVKISNAPSFYVWRFLWLAISGTVGAVILSVVRGHLQLFFQTALLALQNYWLWIAALMFAVFIGQGFKLALKKDHSVSLVLLVTTPQIIIGIVITLLGLVLVPYYFKNVPLDPLVWVVRIIGSILIILGVNKVKELVDTYKLEARV